MPASRNSIKLPEKCANLFCPNRPGEGEFKVETWERSATEYKPGERPIAVLLCAPCAILLQKVEGSRDG